jgi:hypothetical protein
MRVSAVWPPRRGNVYHIKTPAAAPHEIVRRAQNRGAGRLPRDMAKKGRKRKQRRKKKANHGKRPNAGKS